MAPSDTVYSKTSLESPPLLKELTSAANFKIEPIFPYALHSPDILAHVEKMEKSIRACIPSSLLNKPLDLFAKELSEKLPILKWKKPDSAPGCLEFSMLTIASKENDTAAKLEGIIKEWTVPGRVLSLISSNSLYFYWDLFPDKSFLVMDVTTIIESEKDLSSVQTYLSTLTSHLTSSLKNSSVLRDFSQQRPLVQETKQGHVHKQLVSLIEKLPHLFNTDLFIEMSRLFSLCQKSFFDPRPARLITKILAFHSLMRVNLLRLLSLHPEKRHLEVRYIRTHLDFHFGSKPVLGLALGISPLVRHEFFEESHILQATKSLLPEIRTVKGSFYTYQGPQDPICTLYVELEKKNGVQFSSNEICLLKQELEYELKRRIEKLVPAVFMARNEEETMRNVLILSQELRHLSDLPQLMISLDTQTTTEIFFTVILVRLLKANTPPLAKCFESLKSETQFLPDRMQQVGFLKKNTPKEAHVFHLRLPKDSSLLRTDYSVNFYLARSKVSSIIFEAIGPFRDYNGGMILKQGELFYQFQDAFPATAKKSSELLENFFFSLNPIESQATLPLFCLETLFNQFLDAQKAELVQKDDYFLSIEERKKQLFVMLKTPGTSIKEDLTSKLMSHGLCSKSLIQSFVKIQGSLYAGMIFPQADEKKQQIFIELIHSILKEWTNKIQNQQVVKLSFLELPQSLDPRLSGDEYSHILIKMLFEGLTRLDKNGKPDLAAAKSLNISLDLKTYTFKLKRSYWSDGSLVSAYDFEYSWKKILSPDFFTPFAYVFYPIKNAKAAKESLCLIEDVGIKALDDLTLAIELEYPTPEFLELLSLSTYSPVPHAIDKIHPNWSLGKSEDFVCNGPFTIKRVTNHTRYELAKSSFYWDKDQVRIQKILISKDSGFIANEMFKNEEIHWLGQPMRPWDPSVKETTEPLVNFSPMGVYWCVFNTEKFPFHNVHLRQAFDLAIDKNDLTSQMSAEHFPASTPLPLSHTMNHNPNRSFGDEQKALELFEIALEELGLTRKTFPLITLNFVNTPLREHSVAYLVKRWKKLFQIPCRSEGFNFNTLFSKISNGNFQATALYWKSNIDNPSYTLNTFKYGNLDINFSNWSNAEYQELLDAEREELNEADKVKYLSKAEKVLMREVPIFPLFYERKKNMKKSYLHRVLYSKTTGQIDFKYAYIER